MRPLVKQDRYMCIFFFFCTFQFQMYFREKVMVSLSVCCKRFCKVRVSSRKVPISILYVHSLFRIFIANPCYLIYHVNKGVYILTNCNLT